MDPLLMILAMIGGLVVIQPFADKVAQSIVLFITEMTDDRRP